MKTIKDLVMDSLEERIKALAAAAGELVEQVENYTMRAGSRHLLLSAKERLKHLLEDQPSKSSVITPGASPPRR